MLTFASAMLLFLPVLPTSVLPPFGFIRPAVQHKPDPAERYKQWKHLGDGQFGTVYRAFDVTGSREVAIKKIKLGDSSEAKEGVHRTAIREIKFLQECDHPNIIKLFNVFTKESNIHMVLEICDGKDLEQLIQAAGNDFGKYADERLQVTPANIKSLMLMSLQGLEYLHQHWILHRDLKPNNLFLTDKGVLKIADFGLCSFHGSPNRMMTHQVVTIWYRAPELLLGAKSYGAGIDVWAMGCIQAELELKLPFLATDSGKEMAQLDKIWTAVGSVDEKRWPGVTSLRDYVPVRAPIAPPPMRSFFTAASDNAVELITRMLEPCPAKRITVTESLKHPYFMEEPSPSMPEHLPKVKGKTKTKREQSRPGKRKLEIEDGGPGEAEDEDGPGPGKLQRQLAF